jgi:hypothetical protein
MQEAIFTIGFVIICILLLKIKDVFKQNNSILKQYPEPIKAFDGTTTLPPSMAATTCSHQWEVVKDEVLKNDHHQKMITILQCHLCGTLDKTIENIDYEAPKPPTPPPLPRSECRHDWENKKSVEIDSPYEQLATHARVVPNTYGKKEPVDRMVMSPWFFKKTYVSERICSKCGEIHTTIASNYNLEDLPPEVWEDANKKRKD